MLPAQTDIESLCSNEQCDSKVLVANSVFLLETHEMLRIDPQILNQQYPGAHMLHSGSPAPHRLRLVLS